MEQVTLLHGVGQDATQGVMDALHGFFGKRFAVSQFGGFAHFLVKIPDDLLAQVGQFVVPQRGQNPPHILLVAGIGGFCQLFRRHLHQPVVNVLRQCDALVHRLRRVMYLPLEQHRLLLQPLLALLGFQFHRRMYRFLRRFQSVALVVVSARDHNQITVLSSFANGCHTATSFLM